MTIIIQRISYLVGRLANLQTIAWPLSQSHKGIDFSLQGTLCCFKLPGDSTQE